jgi:hypothetical protein
LLVRKKIRASVEHRIGFNFKLRKKSRIFKIKQLQKAKLCPIKINLNRILSNLKLIPFSSKKFAKKHAKLKKLVTKQHAKLQKLVTKRNKKIKKTPKAL